MAERLSCTQACQLPALGGGEAQGDAGSPRMGLGLAPCPQRRGWQAMGWLCWVVQCLCAAGARLLAGGEFLLQQVPAGTRCRLGFMKFVGFRG